MVYEEQLNTIVLNFYNLDQGYSLGFNIKSTNKSQNYINTLETKLLSYNEAEFLFYINSGQIPPILIDLLDRINVCTIYKILFY